MKISKTFKQFLFTLIIVSSFLVDAQDARVAAESQMLINRNRTENSNIKGTPYLTKDFVTAKISPLDKTYLVRYDAHKDDMEVKDEQGRVLILNKFMKTYVIDIINTQQTFKIFSYEPYTALGYFIVLKESPKISLYKKESKEIKEAKPAAYSNMSSTPAQFKKLRPTYYYNTAEDLVLKNIPRSKKQLLKMFPKHTSKLKTFIKKNKIKLKDDEDFIKVFTYLNDIM